jgi:hypothetical protein
MSETGNLDLEINNTDLKLGLRLTDHQGLLESLAPDTN